MNLKENRNLNLHLVEACTHSKGTIGLWNSITKVIKMAKRAGKTIVIVICEDDHFFTENYSSGLLFKEIQEAYMQGKPNFYPEVSEDSDKPFLSDIIVIG